jgi:hypothetical protein
MSKALHNVGLNFPLISGIVFHDLIFLRTLSKKRLLIYRGYIGTVDKSFE